MKVKIAENIHIPPSRQNLVYDGAPLDNSMTISDVGTFLFSIDFVSRLKMKYRSTFFFSLCFSIRNTRRREDLSH